MQTLSFEKLERELQAAGAAPSVIARITQELKDHCADAESAAIARGIDPVTARRQARAGLGSDAAIVAAVAARRSLLGWRNRWPQSARCVDTLAYCLAWPAAPFVFLASQPAWIVRWGVSSSLAACITASILLTMQWLIRVGSIL